jgi:hypothetical protein
MAHCFQMAVPSLEFVNLLKRKTHWFPVGLN